MNKKEFQVFFLFWRFHFFSSLQLHRWLDSWNKNFLWKTKKFWLKESVIRRVLCVSRWCVMSKAFGHLIETSRNEVSISVFFSHSFSFYTLFQCFIVFHEKPFSMHSPPVLVMFYHNSSTCFDLCNGRCAFVRTLEQLLLWYKVTLIMKWDAAFEGILIYNSTI